MAKAKKPVANESKSTASGKPDAEKPVVSKDPSQAAGGVAKPDVKAEATKADAKASEPVKPETIKSTAPEKPAAQKSAASTAASKATSTPAKTSDTAPKSPAKPEDTTKPIDDKKPATPSIPETVKATEIKEPARTTPTRTAEPSPERKSSVFWPLVLGGVIAAALGFFAGELTRTPPEDLRPIISAQEAVMDQQEQRIATLEEAEIVFPEVDLSAINEVAATLEELAVEVQEIDDRLTVVEKQPITDGASEAAVAAYERELAALQASVQAQRTEIEGLIDNAITVQDATAQAAQTATVRAAVADITSAINEGQPFADAVATITDSSTQTVPPVLTDVAGDGVVTLASLQARFPDSARAALTAARASGDDGEGTGVGSFFRRQLGARSVAPRDGDVPDAVLSRAEAAVREGRLAQALQELETLPDAAKEAMQDWLTDAQARQDAVTATQDLSQSLTAN